MIRPARSGFRLRSHRGNHTIPRMIDAFLSYPGHPWLPSWTFEPRGCSSSLRERERARFFRSMEEPGWIGPDTDEPEWTLRIPLPAGSGIRLLFNGFCAYYARRRKRAAFEGFVPEPGIFWGRFAGLPSPELLCRNGRVERLSEGAAWFSGERDSVLLLVRDGYFVLTTGLHDQDEALAAALARPERDLEAEIAREVEFRAAARSFMEESDLHADVLAALAVESLARALRPGEGHVPGPWSQSLGTEDPTLDANEIHSLVLAWRYVDPSVAQELTLTLLRAQTRSGAIPVALSPHKTFSVLEAPKPLLAKAALAAWQARPNEAFLAEAVPLLRRHLRSLTTHFDPKRRGLHCWQSRNESLTPDAFKTDLATADLSALLLSEIEAYDRLSAALRQGEEDPSDDSFAEDRAVLTLNLETLFWNEEEGSFSQAVHRGETVRLEGIPQIVPLACESVSGTRRKRMLDRMQEEGRLPGGLNVLSWGNSAMADRASVLPETIAFEAIRAAGPEHPMARHFARVVVQGFQEWHALSIKKTGTLRFDPLAAAHVLNLQCALRRRGREHGPIVRTAISLGRKLLSDWFDVAVLALCLLAALSVHVFYGMLRAPPPLTALRSEMNRAYLRHDFPVAAEACRRIVHIYPDRADRARLLLANMLIFSGRYADAEPLLREIRARDPDSPGPMVALGMVLQFQGKFKEAEENYGEFCYLFDEIFPDAVARVRKFQLVALEGFREPPVWKRIYNHRMMHEIDPSRPPAFNGSDSVDEKAGNP